MKTGGDGGSDHQFETPYACWEYIRNNLGSLSPPLSVLPRFLLYEEHTKECSVVEGEDCKEKRVLLEDATGAKALQGPALYSIGDICAAYDHLLNVDDLTIYRQTEIDFDFAFGDKPLTEHHRTIARSFCTADCFIIRIIDGVPYLMEDMGSFQSRGLITWKLIMRVVEKFWGELTAKYPRNKWGEEGDLELIVSTSDGYKGFSCHERDCRDGGMMLMIAKSPPDSGGILYPDFSFHSWPEAECPAPRKTGSHLWSRAREDLLSVRTPFQEKIPKLFFRGAPTSVVGAPRKNNFVILPWSPHQ